MICRDGRHPRVQLFTKAFGEHLRKRCDVPYSGFEVWAAGEDLFSPICSSSVRLPSVT